MKLFVGKTADALSAATSAPKAKLQDGHDEIAAAYEDAMRRAEPYREDAEKMLEVIKLHEFDPLWLEYLDGERMPRPIAHRTMEWAIRYLWPASPEARTIAFINWAICIVFALLNPSWANVTIFLTMGFAQAALWSWVDSD